MEMIETLRGVLNQLNNREIAIGVWFLAGFFAALGIKSFRSGLVGLMKGLASVKLLLLFGSLGAYVALLAWLLSLVQLWTFDQVAATVLWYLLSGVGLLTGVFSIQEGDRHFKNLIRSAFALTGVIEFVAVAYTFDLAAEMVLVPVLVSLGLLLGVTDTKKEFDKVKRFLEGILATFGLVLIWVSVRQIVGDPEGFFTTTTGRNLLLPIALTLGSVPVLYSWCATTKIETAFISIDLKNYPPDALKKYARRRFTWAFILRPWLIQRAVRQLHNLPVNTEADVDRIVEAIREHERLAKNPPPVDRSLGWSPFRARDFLSGLGLRTGDYHVVRSQDEYFASSGYVDLDDGTLPNHAAYYLEGDEETVKCLKLKGGFRKQSETTAALARFRAIALELVASGLGIGMEEARKLLPTSGDFSVSHGTTSIIWRRETYPNKQGFDVVFTLVN